MHTQPWIRALGVVVALNVAFLGLALWTTRLPRESLRQRVRDAFADGDLVREDYLPFDSRRGFHQYDECLILQMLTNSGGSHARQALGPLLYIRDSTYTGYCQTLHELVVSDDAPSRFMTHHYARYWHGHMPVASVFLMATDLGTARRILKIVTYLGLLLLLSAALLSRSPHARIVGAAIAVSGLLIWGLPYFAQTFAHAPGDTLVVLGLAGILVWRDALRAPGRFVPYCAAYGALVVYFEFMTGQLPTAAGFLFPLAYAVTASRSGAARREAWAYGTMGLLAFGLGASLTVLAKQVLATTVFGAGPLEIFGTKLREYTGSTGAENPFPDFLLPFGRFLRRGETLTYGDELASYLLYAGSGLAWLVGTCLALRRNDRTEVSASRSDLLALAAGAAVIGAWILVFRMHAFVHADFMVRIVIVPIALGWAALFWQIHAHRRRAAFTPKRARHPG